jgi:hypothetical protein
MSKSFFDILVAKDFESKQSGATEKKTMWNRIGRAWPSKSGNSLSLEFYMFPEQRYTLQLQNKEEKPNE